MAPIPSIDQLKPELKFTTTRSSGPGGQNVNKVNTRVILKFDVTRSAILSEDQKQVVLKNLARFITREGALVLTSQASRSQFQNKETVVLKLGEILRKAFTPKKKRKPTKPGRAVKQKRLQQKKQHAEKKQWRKRPE
jgi:ribosome-associated protein